jgi:hypothetical protein
MRKQEPKIPLMIGHKVYTPISERVGEIVSMETVRPPYSSYNNQPYTVFRVKLPFPSLKHDAFHYVICEFKEQELAKQPK